MPYQNGQIIAEISDCLYGAYHWFDSHWQNRFSAKTTKWCTVVVVKWSACSPSTRSIQVQIPLTLKAFFLKFVIEKNENKQKRGRGWSIFKHQSGIERSSKNKKTQKCLNVHYCVNWLFLQFYNLLLQWTSILPWLGIRKFFPNK